MQTKTATRSTSPIAPDNGAVSGRELAVTRVLTPEEVEPKLIDAGATPDQVEQVLWVFDFAQAQRLQNYTQLERETGINATTLSRVARGIYGAQLDSLCKKIKHVRQLWIERQDWGDEIFVPELSVVRRVAKFADLVRAAGQIGVLFGPNQSGKTKALEYIAQKSEMFAYAKLKEGGGLKDSIKVIAEARGGISTRKNTIELKEIIRRRFNRLWLLVIDEFHQTLIGRTLKTVTIEFIRGIYDPPVNTPILLCGTDVVPEMFDDPKFKNFLGQIANRGVLKMRIPPAPTAKDIELLSQAYGFAHSPTDEAARKIKPIANEHGIGQLSKYFQVTRMLAKKAHERISWKHFLIAHDTMSSWEKGEFGENGKTK